MVEFHFAPVQGHTDVAYRHFHHLLYPADAVYYTPFIRWEREGVRHRDIKECTSELNKDLNLVPQIIFRDDKELISLVEKLKEAGASAINLNMGCPFPLQTGHGRGAAAISNQALAENIAEVINKNQEIIFSVKMRLGYENKDEWKSLLPVLNSLTLDNISVHPRIARQQYSGELNFESFSEILRKNNNPTIYNGEIKTPEEIAHIIERFPDLKGVMIGRGLLARPSLIEEYICGEDYPREKRIDRMLQFHRELFTHYSRTLCGESQILSKIKPFWEYAEEEIGRKAWKAIKKSTNMAKYNSAVALI